MKNLLILLIIGFAAYGGYTLWNNQRQPARVPKVAEAPAVEPDQERPPLSAPAKTPTRVPETVKAPEPEPPMPVAPPKRLAPEGVFYAVQAFSVTTDSGIRGIRAGMPVKLVKDNGPVLRVTDGQQEFDARRELLTNDLDIAAKAANQQASQQAANAEWHREQQALAEAARQKNAIAMEATQERVQQLAESARAAAEERTQRMAEIRAQISAAEAHKDRRFKPSNITYQKHLDNQNEEIRLLQLELGRLGVAGAALERR